MNRQQILAHQIRESRTMLLRYAKGFDGEYRVRQAPGLPNHFAWTLGHLAHTLHRTAEKLDGKPMPEADFIKADGRGGTADRFDTESVCFNSKPVSEPGLYPSPARCQTIFDAAIERCAAAFERATDAQLDALTRWGAMEIPMWSLGTRMVFHNGTHTGQLADLRRALGLGSIFS